MHVAMPAKTRQICGVVLVMAFNAAGRLASKDSARSSCAILASGIPASMDCVFSPIACCCVERTAMASREFSRIELHGSRLTLRLPRLSTFGLCSIYRFDIESTRRNQQAEQYGNNADAMKALSAAQSVSIVSRAILSYSRLPVLCYRATTASLSISS